MTTEPNQYADLVQQSQQAVIAAVETWTKTIQDAFSALPSTLGQVDANESVDKVFDFTEKVLEMQRDFTKKVISTSASAAESAKAAVVKATEDAKRSG